MSSRHIRSASWCGSPSFEPSGVALAQIRARLLVGREPVVNMPPVIGTGIDRIDAELLDRVDRLQHALDLRPAGDAQEDFPAGAHIADGGKGFARMRSSQDVDSRDD